MKYKLFDINTGDEKGTFDTLTEAADYAVVDDPEGEVLYFQAVREDNDMYVGWALMNFLAFMSKVSVTYF